MNEQHAKFSARLVNAGVWDAQGTIRKSQAAGMDYEQMSHIMDYWEEDGSGTGSLVWRLTNAKVEKESVAKQRPADAERWDNLEKEASARQRWNERREKSEPRGEQIDLMAYFQECQGRNHE